MTKFISITVFLLLMCACSDKSNLIIETKENPVTVSDVQKLDIKAQKVYVSGLRSRKKTLDLFKEKLILVLNGSNNKFDEAKEQKFIKELIEIIDSDAAQNYPSTKKIFDQKLMSWYMRSSSETGWEELVYKFLLFSLEDDYEKYTNSNSLSAKSLTMKSSDCECSTSGQGFFIKDCAGPEVDCLNDEAVSCETTPDGCGTFWGDSCNGYCDGPNPDAG